MILSTVYCDVCNPDQQRRARGMIYAKWERAFDLGWIRDKRGHVIPECQDEQAQARQPQEPADAGLFLPLPAGAICEKGEDA